MLSGRITARVHTGAEIDVEAGRMRPLARRRMLFGAVLVFHRPAVRSAALSRAREWPSSTAVHSDAGAVALSLQVEQVKLWTGRLSPVTVDSSSILIRQGTRAWPSGWAFRLGPNEGVRRETVARDPYRLPK